MTFAPSGIVTLLTDFGSSDGYVAQMKAVMLRVSPKLRFVDISHDVAPQDVAQGAFLLDVSARWFPAGTVHLAVVDPGVGSERAAIAMVAGGHALVGPDNGLLMHAAETLRDSTHRAWRLDNVTAPGEAGTEPAAPVPQGLLSSFTFHGRDLFAPAAALLAAGLREPESLGRPIDPGPALVPSVEGPDRGRVVHVDRFGNLITSLSAETLDQVVSLEIGGHRVPTGVRFYAEAPAGTPVFLAGSSGRIEVSVRGGAAADLMDLSVGAPVVLLRA